MLRSDLHAESSGEILREGLATVEEEPLVVNPTRETMRALVETVKESRSPVKLFADPRPLKDLVDDFLVASTLADLVEEGVLDIRTLEDVPRHSLFVSEEFIVSFVESQNETAGLTTTEESFVTETVEYYETRWERADAFTLRTPPLTHIRETLESEIGSEAVDDFDRMLDTLETARGDGEGLDEVTITLLVAANNRELLYDISRWGEDIRLASKATFSRTKNHLEDAGLIDTEKVPIDVGRPRLRLLLGETELEEASIETVTQQAEQRLA